MAECWKDIPGYEGFYQVSNLGMVRSVERTRLVKNRYGYESFRTDSGKMMAGSDNGNGYLIVSLKKNGARKSKYIHRLVAEAFLPREDGCDTVNHKDYNTKNNCAENLEWCTQKENVRYSSERMRKEKSKCKTSSTGEKYISIHIEHGKKKYRVAINRFRFSKSFSTLEEAILCRNEVVQNA